LNNTAGQINICSLRLRDVLYYPMLANNMISVSQMTDAGFITKFTKNSCHFMDSNENSAQCILSALLRLVGQPVAYVKQWNV